MRVRLIGAVTLTALCLESWFYAVGGTTNLPFQSQMLSAPAAAPRNPNLVVSIGPAQQPLRVAPIPKGKVMVATPVLKPIGTNSLALLSRIPKNAAFLKPGLYTTEPYKSIVIVPDKHPDDRAIISGVGGNEVKMPMIQPELRFIPYEISGK